MSIRVLDLAEANLARYYNIQSNEPPYNLLQGARLLMETVHQDKTLRQFFRLDSEKDGEIPFNDRYYEVTIKPLLIGLLIQRIFKERMDGVGLSRIQVFLSGGSKDRSNYETAYFYICTLQEDLEDRVRVMGVLLKAISQVVFARLDIDYRLSENSKVAVPVNCLTNEIMAQVFEPHYLIPFTMLAYLRTTEKNACDEG